MARCLFSTPLDQALARMGSLSQGARLDPLSYEDGPMRGSRLLRLVTGGGLSFEVHPDRALDIGSLEVDGRNCAWLSPTRIANPALYDGSAPNFLRTFGGGFLMTCGLDHTGPRHEANGEVFPQHGRIGATPASVTRTEITDDGLVVEGVVRQVAAMKEHLCLRRRIFAPLGGRELTVTDTVKNESDLPQPHVVMYHCNFGWPLLSEAAHMRIDSVAQVPQTADAEASPFAQLKAPVANERECVYLHEMKPGRVQAVLENPQSRLRMAMTFDSKALPSLVEWKMMAKHVYALGLEPTNVRALGHQQALRDKNLLPMLEPGEQVTYELKFELEGPASPKGGSL
jgi:galactose mutarotase-like enzyme